MTMRATTRMTTATDGLCLALRKSSQLRPSNGSPQVSSLLLLISP